VNDIALFKLVDLVTKNIQKKLKSPLHNWCLIIK
jgi:hypothetical protein